ncbi:hypothetical protein [Nannocystis punicea]|uniref:Uncharacterized protein n=1 Tax=Nannocystis punicea TaxID=2995304 RepID=A0ABY7HFI9_9BACT|nr:hypothetical protein [Nannocystis poenicansa]WAS98053.1 hypothetical protein O0S08_18075 [Nannocystis poenicansa]
MPLMILVACGGQTGGPSTTEADETGAGTSTTTGATVTGTTGATGTGTTTESPTGSDSGETASPLACEDGEFPGPEVPLQCAMCIVVDDQPGFCADGVVNPACVDGRWKCIEDSVPHELCPYPSAPCQLDEESSGST